MYIDILLSEYLKYCRIFTAPQINILSHKARILPQPCRVTNKQIVTWAGYTFKCVVPSFSCEKEWVIFGYNSFLLHYTYVSWRNQFMSHVMCTKIDLKWSGLFRLFINWHHLILCGRDKHHITDRECRLNWNMIFPLLVPIEKAEFCTAILDIS